MLAQKKAKTSSVSFTAISWYLKLCQTHKRHLINVYWMTKWISVVLCLFSHSLVAWTSWCHLAWQAPIHIVRLSSALTFSKPFLASLLPKRRSTFLFVTLQLSVVHRVCVCVRVHVCICCVCEFVYFLFLSSRLWFCNTSIHSFVYIFITLTRWSTPWELDSLLLILVSLISLM